jgi:hypothetical protein
MRSEEYYRALGGGIGGAIGGIGGLALAYVGYPGTPLVLSIFLEIVNAIAVGSLGASIGEWSGSRFFNCRNRQNQLGTQLLLDEPHVRLEMP